MQFVRRSSKRFLFCANVIFSNRFALCTAISSTYAKIQSTGSVAGNVLELVATVRCALVRALVRIQSGRNMSCFAMTVKRGFGFLVTLHCKIQ